MTDSCIKKVENLATKTSVFLLFLLTLIGIMFIFDSVCDIDFFPNKYSKNAFLIFCLTICVIIASCVMVATMINISRMANAIERMAETKGKITNIQ